MSYENKYKERVPQETIEVIKKFFIQEKQFKIKILRCEKKANIDIWSCTLALYYNNNLILTSNGKGCSEQYALASGYSELYERFCNKVFWLNNPFIFNKVISQNYQSKNYYLHPDEKYLNYEDAIFYIKDYISAVSDSESNPKEFFTNIFDGQFIGIPFTEINENDKIFLDPRLIYQVKYSSGMAAGNTFFEAFNQGASELCEHFISGIYLTDPYKKYYRLNLSNIENVKLQKIIKQIENSDNDLYVYDFSYNCNLPVLMSMLVNHITKSVSINIGSFPVFEIALERVLTELYQGSGNYDYVKTIGHIPYKSKTPIEHERINPSNTTLKTSFPENLILNSIQVDSYNTKVFLQDNIDFSNKDIYNFFINLFKKESIKMYYCNNSQSEDMYAIQLFSPNLQSFVIYRENSQVLNKNIIYLFLNKFYEILKEENITTEELKIIFEIYKRFDIEQKNLINVLINTPWLTLFNMNGNQGYPILLFLMDGNYTIDNINNILDYNYNSSYYSLSQKYLLLMKFCLLKEYSYNEIKLICQFLGFSVNNDDILNYNNIDYLIQNICINPFKKYFKTDTYDSYFQKLI